MGAALITRSDDGGETDEPPDAVRAVQRADHSQRRRRRNGGGQQHVRRRWSWDDRAGRAVARRHGIGAAARQVAGTLVATVATPHRAIPARADSAQRAPTGEIIACRNQSGHGNAVPRHRRSLPLA
jgi:hypothetical protein